jgi:predicted phage tail component-like protein
MRYYINKKDLQYFTYDNKVSSDFGIIITKINQLSAPQRNIEVIEVDGRQGPILNDKGNYKPFELELECSIDSSNANINDISRDIKRLLQTDFRFKKLILSDDDEYYYEAVCINKLDIEEVIEQLGEFQLVFLCKPLRKVLQGENKITLTKHGVIYNKYIVSRPNIKIVGNGDITININNQKLILKNVENEIEVDSEIMNCYKSISGVVTNQNNKMYSEFPIIEEGLNNISWTGNVTRVEIIPRWVVI